MRDLTWALKLEGMNGSPNSTQKNLTISKSFRLEKHLQDATVKLKL